MDYDATYTELNTRIGDSGDVTFTPEEKASALHKAWNDSFVVKTVWDSTTTWAANTWSYVVPTALDTVKDIYTAYSSSYAPEPISADLYEVVDGRIRFRQEAGNIFSAGNTVYVKGNKKLDYATDTLPTTNLEEYVIASAGFNTLTLLGHKKANLFLKNDVSMSELVTLRRELDTERKELRGKLLREWEGA